MEELPNLKIRKYSDIADCFAAIRRHLSLSEEFCENLGGLTKGHLQKTIGAGTRTKRIGPTVFDILCELFAVEFVPRINPEARLRMQKRYEFRNRAQVRVPPSHPLSAEVLERAKAEVFSEMGKRSAAMRTVRMEMTKSVRKAATARWRAHRRNGHNGHAASK